jgi:transposase
MSAAFIGPGPAKSVFQVHGVDAHGKVGVTKRLRRDTVLAFFANLPACVVGLEACAGLTLPRQTGPGATSVMRPL